MYTNFITNNSKMKSFVNSILAQLDESVKKVKDEKIAELLNSKVEMLEKAYKAGKKEEATLIRSRGVIPFRKQDYIKQTSVNTVQKILNNLNGYKQNICSTLNRYLKKKIDVKTMQSKITGSADEGFKFETAWRDLQGHTTTVEKLVIIDLLKELYNIKVPVLYKSVPRIYPVYPFHLIGRFIKLQCFDENKSKIPEELHETILNDIFDEKNKPLMKEYIENSENAALYSNEVKSAISDTNVDIDTSAEIKVGNELPYGTHKKMAKDAIQPKQGDFRRR